MIVLEVQKKQEIFESINLHRQYEDYLQSVIRILPPNYFNTNEPTINDILLRYKTLHETNMDLVESIEKNQQSVETCQEKLSKMIKENDDQVLVYNAMLGQQQKEYDKIVQDGQIKEQRNDEYHKSVKEKVTCCLSFSSSEWILLTQIPVQIDAYSWRDKTGYSQFTRESHDDSLAGQLSA